jgi:hypothetical protein
MPDPSLELQRALRAQLLASPAVTALVGQRIYDQPPITPQFPYITLGETDVQVQRASFYDGSDVSMSFHAWSRANGYPESKRIAAAIRASLHEAPITLAGLERLVDIEVQSNRAFRDPDGLTSHAVITVRALTEPVNEEGDLKLVGAAGFQAQGASTRAGALALAGSAALQASALAVSPAASAFAGSSSFAAAAGAFQTSALTLAGNTALQAQATAIRSTVLALSGSTTLQARGAGTSTAALTLSGSTALQARAAGVSPAALTLSGSTAFQARAPAALPPTITSSTTQTVAENTPFSLNLTASEAGTWAITGGADAAMFEITGSSASAEALDFELPEDADHNNVYDVQVTFTSSATGLTDTKTFHLTVTDVAEGTVLQLTGRTALAFAGQVAGGGAWTPASLDGTVRYFSVKLSVTQSGGVVTAVPDLNGGSAWAPHGTGSNLSYSATSFSGSTPGITTTGGKGLRNTISTGGSSVWFFFANCYIDAATDSSGGNTRVYSIAPNGGFQDFGTDGAGVSAAGSGGEVGVLGSQDGTPVAGGKASRNAYHRIGYVCNGSIETVYVDGVVAAQPSGTVNPGTPPTAPHTLNAAVSLGFFIRAEAGGSGQGATGQIQSGIFKVGGTAPDSTTLANIDAWLQNPV